MTDAEADAGAWAELAENLEGAGYVHLGLCDTLDWMSACQAIRAEQCRRMRRQLRRHRHELAGAHPNRNFYWSIGALKPRIAACRKLARITA